MMTILEVMADKDLFLPWFKGDSWRPWRAFLAALFGLPMDAEAFKLFCKHTGRTVRPTEPFTEAYSVIGRRGGKSLVLALIVVYCAIFRSYTAVSVPGESLIAMLLASDKKQAAILLRYVTAFFDKIPVLAQMVTGRTAESITLSNGITILVATSDYRAVRGYTLIVCACDELAFWQSGDSASPDREVLDAVRPAHADRCTAL
jgi:hypothetical protein